MEGFKQPTQTEANGPATGNSPDKGKRQSFVFENQSGCSGSYPLSCARIAVLSLLPVYTSARNDGYVKRALSPRHTQ